MAIYNIAGGRNHALAVFLVSGIFVAFLLGSGRDMDFSPAYLLVIAYLLWMGDKGNHYYIFGAITTALMALGFFLTTSPETRTLSLFYSNLLMVILVWVVIYFIYQQKSLVGRMEKIVNSLIPCLRTLQKGFFWSMTKGKL